MDVITNTDVQSTADNIKNDARFTKMIAEKLNSPHPVVYVVGFKESMPAVPLQEPKYTFEQIILSEQVLEELEYAVKFDTVRNMVYSEWGLETIEPCSKLALNFWGDAGTGKTMAAHGLAHRMGKKIIPASYAEIESKYHGDGPKNVKALFRFATENNAVLFIDEADSLLSKRLTNVTQGSEQAINSMRSQLLIEIENYTGVVIFATNLASNYDSAFITRIKSIHFEKPGTQRCQSPNLPSVEIC